MDNGQKFIELAEKQFDFMEKDYGWKLLRTNPNEMSGSEIEFVNPFHTLAINLRLDWREHTFFARLIKLVNGRVPPYPIFPRENDPVHWIYIDYLVNLRAPGTKILDDCKGPIQEREMESWLKRIADLLTNHAKDLLAGDLAGLEDLEKAVKQNIAKVREMNKTTSRKR